MPKLREMCGLFNNVSPTTDNWISGASGHSSITYNCIITYSTVRAEIYLGTASQEKNVAVYNEFLSRRKEIEHEFGSDLIWENKEDKITRKIYVELQDVELSNEADWSRMVEFQGQAIKKFTETFQNRLDSIIKFA